MVYTNGAVQFPKGLRLTPVLQKPDGKNRPQNKAEELTRLLQSFCLKLAFGTSVPMSLTSEPHAGLPASG